MTDVLTAVPDVDGVHHDLPDDLYHADRGSLSFSGAKLLVPPSTPEEFVYTMNNPKTKKEWDFGHVAHRIILGKGAEFTVLDPDVDGLKVDGTPSDKPASTAMWRRAEADARAAGRIPISLDLCRQAEAMAAKVRAHDEAGPIFADPGGRAEVSLYHTDQETGVRLRGRVDWIESCGDLDDVKTSTTADPVELQLKFYKLRYFMQAAWYIDLAIACGVSKSPAFKFIVVKKDPPHVVTVVQFDADAITEGRRLNRQAIDLYAKCRRTKKWPGSGPGPHVISLPLWAFDDEEMVIA